MIDELRSVGDRALGVSRATPGRAQDGCLSKWYRAWAACLITVGELGGVCALELALEEPVQLRITRCLLAVLDAEGIRLGRGSRVKIKSFGGEETLGRTVLRGC